MGTRVGGPLLENGRVVGLMVEGEARRARLTIAADGAHSKIRHALRLDIPDRKKRVGMCAHFRLAPGQEQSSWVDVFVRRGHELYVTPLAEQEILVAGLAQAEVLKAPIVRTFENWWQNEPELAARLEGAEQITPLITMSPLAGRARKGFVPGLALLGDAAGFVDPITGGGMTQALMSAELLASYIAANASNSEEWLPKFDRARQALLRDYRRLTQIVLWVSEHPGLGKQLLAGMSRSPGIFSHLIGVSGGVRKLFGGTLGGSNPAHSRTATRMAISREPSLDTK
jgi:flavin-dependent dehydrogenase